MSQQKTGKTASNDQNKTPKNSSQPSAAATPETGLAFNEGQFSLLSQLPDHRTSRPLQQKSILQMQRLRGNQVTTARLQARHPLIQRQPDRQENIDEQIAEVQELKLTQLDSLEQIGQIQRAPDAANPAAEVDKGEALIRAVNLANKNSLLKIKVPVKAPPGHKIFGGLELKKLELEIDVVGEAIAPGVSNTKSTTKVGGGVQNVGTKEIDPVKNSATEAQGTAYALELEQKFGSSPFADMFSFKLGGEYGSYTPTNALTPNKQEFKGKLAFQIAAEGFSLEIGFVPVAYDRTKKGSDAFKLGTFSGKVAKEFTMKMPAMLNIGGFKVDVNLKVKVSGTAEVGPDYALVYKELAKKVGKEAEAELAKKIAPEIAKEEMQITYKKLVQELIEDETKDITDATVKKTVTEVAERELMKEMQKRELELAAAKEADFFIRRELTEQATERLSIIAIRSEIRSIVQNIAKPLATELRPLVKAMIKTGIQKASLRGLVQSIAKNLVAGPVDFVLVGIQILYNYVDTIIKDVQLKELGLRVMACRDNYVAGYTAGLNGAASPGGAGGSNLEGAAHMLGLKEGGDQFKAILDLHLQGSQVPREEAIADLVEMMQGMPINKSSILAKATPKIKEMILSAYEKEHSGGVMRWMFGEDFKSTKDYKHFRDYIEQYLQTGATNTIRARLKRKGVDKEVYVTLVMLDSTSDRAQKFRTEDGRYMVTLSGDTENYSGWVTEDGKPLEDIYMTQDKADDSGSEENKAAHVAEMKRLLSSGVLLINASYNGFGFTFSSVELTRVPDDLKFQEFMRSPDALGMTVTEAGLAVHINATQRYEKAVTGLDANYDVEFSAYGAASNAVVKITDKDGIPTTGATKGIELPDSPSWTAQVKSAVKTSLGDRRLAALPKLG